tara:strand:+ start:86 stop:571 length:486 start_codon:yes stop_codon:yes gene_type:complete
MMGVGKSTVGKELSKKLGYKFIDMDNLIEKKEDLTITKIFRVKGENYFRKIEENLTLGALRDKKVVISLGGGAFLNPKIRKEVLKNTVSFWLNLSIKSLLLRVSRNKKRPLIEGNYKKKMTDIYSKRKDIYKLANYKIDCDNLKKFEVVKKILKLYEKNKH